MNIFYVIDSAEDISAKVDLIQSVLVGAEFRFFVLDQYAPLFATDKFVKKHLVATYTASANASMDEYVKSHPEAPTFVIYNSAYLDVSMLVAMQEHIVNGSKVVYFKYDQKNTARKRINNFFSKCAVLIVGDRDSLCTAKVQYLSAECVKILKLTKFKYRIFTGMTDESAYVYYGDDEKPAMRTSLHWSRYIYVMLALFVASLAGYIVCEVLWDIPFLVAFCAICVSVIFLAFTMMFVHKSVIDSRMNM